MTKEELPKAYDPKSREEKWLSFWEKGRFFSVDPHSKKEPFCIVIPPPNVTGVLHMGHALVDTLQDILIRWKRMDGFEVFWAPGTDHAGIATQAVVEKEIFKQEGKRRRDFSKEEFVKRVWQWKEKSEKTILHQLLRLGCSFDPKDLRFTMDPNCCHAVRKVFKKMYDDGLIYQGDYLVNWDPVVGTALSDDEVEFEERKGFLWHIRYPIEGEKSSITIATTRPETLLGDSAVAVHPEDVRYRNLIGKKILLPLTGRKIPIVADFYVDPSFGTGAVKITPAHDFNDFEVGKRHNLENINVFTADGKINEKGGAFAGLSILEAREKVVQKLSEEKLLEKQEPHMLRVGVSYRSKATLEPYLSKQWFIRAAPFKEKLLSLVKEKRIELVPEHWEETYFHWIENLRDWCISRQIWWGHPIPIWYLKKDREVKICYDGEGLPPEVKKNPEDWEQDPDVLDTWFSSALWPFSALGWPERKDLLDKFYPTSTLVTGHDILFFWVARMILMGDYVMGKIPFHQVFLHGLIYGKSYWKRSPSGEVLYLSPHEKKEYDLGKKLPADIESKWEKMSKSKGNVIDPLEIIQEFGTDALRFALTSSVTFARQIDLDLRRFEEFKNFANKVWNGARFVLMHVEKLSSKSFEQGLDLSLLELEDRWILSLFDEAVQYMRDHLRAYAFEKVATRAYEFFWNDFCAVYVELTKPLLFEKETSALQDNKRRLLLILLVGAIRLLHPIAPFITEEIFSHIQARFSNLSLSSSTDVLTRDAIVSLNAPSITVAPYPNALSFREQKVENDFALLYEIVTAIRHLRTEMQIPIQEKTQTYLILKRKDPLFSLLEKEKKIIFNLTPTLELFLLEEEPSCFGASHYIGNLKIILPLPDSLKAKERARLEKEKEKLEKLKESTEKRLQNEEFLSKAPPNVVEKLKESYQKTEKELEEVQKKAAELKSFN